MPFDLNPAHAHLHMTRDLKFTSYGIPYTLEFENVSVVPEQRNKERHQNDRGKAPHHDTRGITQSKSRRSYYASSPSPSSSTSSFCLVESPPRAPCLPSLSFRSPSSLFRRKPCETSSDECPPPLHPIPPQSDKSSHCAITRHAKPLPPTPFHREVSDIQDIYIRFTPKDAFPQMSRKDRLVRLQKTISAAVLEAGMNSPPGHTTDLQEPLLNEGSILQGTRGHGTTDALFCGTYGQMMDALECAALSATPCREEDLSGCTRLGALFVARNDGTNGVQLRKITLWG